MIIPVLAKLTINIPGSRPVCRNMTGFGKQPGNVIHYEPYKKRLSLKQVS